MDLVIGLTLVLSALLLALLTLARFLRLLLRRRPAATDSQARALALQDVCPRCQGELDTGWECNDCGFDAYPLIT